MKIKLEQSDIDAIAEAVAARIGAGKPESKPAKKGKTKPPVEDDEETEEEENDADESNDDEEDADGSDDSDSEEDDSSESDDADESEEEEENEKPAKKQSGPSRKEVVAALTALTKAKGGKRDKAIELIEKFAKGSTKLDDVPATKYGAIIEAAQKAAKSKK